MTNTRASKVELETKEVIVMHTVQVTWSIVASRLFKNRIDYLSLKVKVGYETQFSICIPADQIVTPYSIFTDDFSIWSFKLHILYVGTKPLQKHWDMWTKIRWLKMHIFGGDIRKVKKNRSNSNLVSIVLHLHVNEI